MFLLDLYHLNFIDQRLKLVMNDIIGMLGTVYITSLYRPEDEGIHNTIPLRALDIRCRDGLIGGALEKAVNKKWIYDPQRPQMKVCWFHDSGRGIHLHIQVHSRTRRRGDVILDDSD